MSEQNQNIDWKLRNKVMSGQATIEEINRLKKTDSDYYQKHFQVLIDARDKAIISNEQSTSTLTKVIDAVIPSGETETTKVDKPPSTSQPKPTPTPPPPNINITPANNTPYYPDSKPVPQPAPAPEPDKPILTFPNKELFAGEIDIIKKLANTNTITTDELEQIKKLSPKTYQNITKYIKYYNKKVKVINSKHADAQYKTAINSAKTGALTPEDLVGLSEEEITKIINLQSADATSKNTTAEANAKMVQTLIDAGLLTVAGPGLYSSIKGMEAIHGQIMKSAEANQNEIKPTFPEHLTAYQLALKLQTEKKPIPNELLNQLSTDEIKFLQGQYNSDIEIQHTKNIQAETLDLTEGGLVATETVIPLIGSYIIPKAFKNLTQRQAVKQTKKILLPNATDNSTIYSPKNTKTNLAPTTKEIIPEITNSEIDDISKLSISEMTPSQLQQHEKEITELVNKTKTLQNPKDKWMHEYWQTKLSKIKIHSQTLSKDELTNTPKMEAWLMMKKGFSEDFKMTEISDKRYIIELKTGQIVGSCPKKEFENTIFGSFGKYSLKQETIDGIPWQITRNAEGKIINQEKIEVLKQRSANDIIQYALNPSQYKIFDRKLTNGTLYRFVENRQTNELTRSYILNDSGKLNFDLFKTGSPDNIWKKSENIFAYGQEWRVQKNFLNQILEITPDNKITSLAEIGSNFSHQTKLSQAINIIKKHESSIVVYFPKINSKNAIQELKSNYLKLKQIEQYIPESLMEKLKNNGLKIILGDSHPHLLRQPTVLSKITKRYFPDYYSGIYYPNEKTAYCGTKISSKFDKTTPHEIGHAFDFLSNPRIGISSEMKDIHIEIYDKLRPYISTNQGIPGCIRGQEELFADAFADYLVFIKQNGAEIGKESFILKYNEKLYNYFNKILSPYLIK